MIIGGGGAWLSRRRVLLDEDFRAERLALAAMAADRRRVVTGISGKFTDVCLLRVNFTTDTIPLQDPARPTFS